MNREQMIDLIKSPSISPITFDFDQMKAPPMLHFITPGDLQYLQYLANSIKLNAKLNYKYSEIDKVLTNRGFEKIGSGTNRVAYKHLEFPTICLKVAASRTACTDSPREMINQNYLKPFVAKIFEVDPTGTVALCERVDPIRNREEFMMIVNEVFDLVTQWFTGKYVVDDIGTNFFMNWGTRLSNGFPVLHDYPYFYPLDPKKLICRKIYEDGITVCNGEIDYDAGYNYLICTKCGKVYKANELAKAAENKSIIINEKGVSQMRVTITKGEDILKTFDPVSEAKKIEGKYAEAEEKMLKARVVAVKDENYVKQLHSNDNKENEQPALKVSVVHKEDKSVFKTDGEFIPRSSIEEHDDSEVVVEKSPLVAGASNKTTEIVENESDGEIDHGEFDDEPQEESFGTAMANAIYEAIEESKEAIVDTVDDMDDQSDEMYIDVEGAVVDPDQEDGRSEEDTVLIAGASNAAEDPEEEEEATEENYQVDDNSVVTDDGEVETVVQENEEVQSEEPEVHNGPQRSRRFDPTWYAEASQKGK